MMTFFKNKKRVLQLGLFMANLLIVAFLLNLPLPANASQLMTDVGGDADHLYMDGTSAGVKPSSVAKWILTLILQFLQALSGFILGLGMALVDLTLSDKLYSQVFFAAGSVQAINIGWGLVRDFVNMFFILVLIFVAIATILRVNKFSDKKFIVYVVSAALFVNFSKPITLFVIDISNLAMSFFLSNIREGNASYTAALLNAQGMGEVFKADTQKASTMGMFVSWAVEIVFKFIMGIMLLALGLSLVVRLVALWVLIILSPLAFFAMALPGTAIGNIKGTWLNKLTYWCFYGPIMLFFFWLALVIVSNIGANVATGAAEAQLAGVNDDHFVIGALKVFIPYSACIYMLFYGFDLSKEMAGKAGNGASWGLSKMGSIAKGAAFAGTAGYGFGYGKAAWSNTKEHFKKNLAAGSLQKKAIIPGGSVDHAKHKSNLVDEETKKWDEKGTPSTDKLKKIMETRPTIGKTIGNAAGITETRAQAEARRKAAAIKLAEKGELNNTDYEKAVNLFGGDEKNLDKFKKAAKKKNLGSMIEHEIKTTMDESIDQDVLNANSSLSTPMSPAVEAAFRRNKQKGFRKKMYEKHLGGMKLGDITEQSADFLKSKEVQDYIEERQTDDDERFSQKNIRKQVAENLDVEKQEALKKFFKTP